VPTEENNTDELMTGSGKKYTAKDYEDAYNLHPTTFLPYETLKIPENVMTLIYGNKGVGKSTIALNIGKACANEGKSVLYIDTEAALSSERLEQLQVNPEFFHLKQMGYVEDFYDFITSDSVLGYDLIILDGIERLSFVTEAENDANSANIGVKARILNKIFRIVNMKFYENKITTIFINHERPNVGGVGHYVPGGQGQLNTSSHTIRFYKTQKGRFIKNGKIAGTLANGTIQKSRFMPEGAEVTLKIHFDTAEVEDVTDKVAKKKK
jgi:RecA/RadA recombinase